MDWQIAYLRAARAPVTAANIKFLNTWQPFEGGSTHNNATNNYLNTTWGKQYPSINSVGVRAYPDLQTGANAFAQTLEGNGNYSGLLKGLRTGDPFKLGSRTAASLSTWLTGSPTSAKGLEYAQKVLGATQSAPNVTRTPLSALPSPGPSPAVSDAVFQSLGQRPTDSLTNLVNAVAAAGPQQAPPQYVPSPQRANTPLTKGFKVGDPIPGQFQSSIGGLHETEGLSGFPAHDYFAKAGAPVVAPITGTVIRLSGHNPKIGPTQGPHGPFGWSVYIKGTDGRTYYLTHLGSRNVSVGDKVTGGTQIGTVGNYAKYGTPSHIHQGVNK